MTEAVEWEGIPPDLDAIPRILTDRGYWCAWEAVPKKDGFDKIPYANGRISTRTPGQWLTFEQAARLYREHNLAGVGRLVDPKEPITYIDIDHCLDELGNPDASAQVIIDQINSYTEISPSGTGLRIVAGGRIPSDIGWREDGRLEMYNGHAPRFVTLTGQVFAGHDAVRKAQDALQALHAEHARHDNVASIDPAPPLLAPAEYSLKALELLSEEHAGFLVDGYPLDQDRSKLMIQTAHELAHVGYDPQEVYSILCNSPGSFALALSKRRGDEERAREYLWRHHAARVNGSSASLEGFEDLTGSDPAPANHGLLHIAQVKAKLGPINWLVDGYFEADTTGCLFGDPESYKSFLAIDVALHVASGRPWCGATVHAPGPVIYVAGEGHGGFARRIAAWEREHVPVDELPMYFTTRPADLYNAQSAKALAQQIKMLAGQLDTPPALIVIDTLARNFGPGDENSTADMNRFVQHVDQALRAPFRAVVLIVHHTGHANKDRARGAMALRGALDFEYRAAKDKFTPLTVQLSCSKMKDAEHPADLWLQGAQVPLGLEDNATSLVFQPCEAPIQIQPDMPDVSFAGLRALLVELADDRGVVVRAEAWPRAIELGLCKSRDSFRVRLSDLEATGFLERIPGGKLVRVLDGEDDGV